MVARLLKLRLSLRLSLGWLRHRSLPTAALLATLRLLLLLLLLRMRILSVMWLGLLHHRTLLSHTVMLLLMRWLGLVLLVQLRLLLMLAKVKLSFEAVLSTESKVVVNVVFFWLLFLFIFVELFLVLLWFGLRH